MRLVVVAASVVAALVVAACGSSQTSETAPPLTAGEGVDAGPAEPSIDTFRVLAITRAVNQTTAYRHACWAAGAADDYQLSGRVVIEIGFNDEGEVRHVIVVEDATKDRALTRCLTALYEEYSWPKLFDSTHSVRLPFEFSAPRAQYTVRSSHVAEGDFAGGKLATKVLLSEKNTGNPAIGMTMMVVRDGLEVDLHQHGSTEVLHVISGEGLVYDLRGAKYGRKVGPGDVIYLAVGTPHGFNHVGSEELRLLGIYAPAGGERRFAGGTDPGTAPVAAPKRKPRKFAPVKIATSGSLTPLAIADGKGSVAIAFDADSAGDATVYAGTLTLQAGAEVADHNHAGATEALFLTAGTGTLIVAGVHYPVAAGDAIQLPPGVDHSLVVGVKGLTAIHFYTPSGPEQRFKE